MKNKAPVFVVFEGLDGTGKSTCAKKLAHSLGAEFMATPSEQLRPLRQKILDSFGSSQEAAQLFYLATVFDASRRVVNLMSSGQSVVLDRYYISTQAYAEFRGSSLTNDSMQEKLQPADFTIMLEAPLATRIERIKARGGSAADHETLTAEANSVLKKTHAQRSKLPVVGRLLSFDTSKRSVDEIVHDVLLEISNR